MTLSVSTGWLFKLSLTRAGSAVPKCSLCAALLVNGRSGYRDRYDFALAQAGYPKRVTPDKLSLRRSLYFLRCKKGQRHERTKRVAETLVMSIQGELNLLQAFA